MTDQCYHVESLWDLLPEEIKEEIDEYCWIENVTRRGICDQQLVKCKIWKKGDKLHRDYGKPAVIYENGDQFWYVDGVLKRPNNLPTIVYGNRDTTYYVDGKYIKSFSH